MIVLLARVLLELENLVVVVVFARLLLELADVVV